MKQNKPSQIRTSTSSALPPLHQEWALGSWWELSNRPWVKGSVPSEHPLSVGTGRTPCACVLCRGVTGGQTFRGWIVHMQWDPRDAVLERLLPVESILFSMCPLLNEKKSFAAGKSTSNWHALAAVSVLFLFLFCVRWWSRRVSVLQGEAELWVGSWAFLIYFITSQQSPVTRTSSRYVNCPLKLNGKQSNA